VFALDDGDRILDARKRVGVDRFLVGLRHEAVEHVRDQAIENRRIGDEELRLVVVAHEGQSALKHAAVVDMRDLGREVVALNTVGVVQEVERVIDRQAEARAPRDEALVNLGRDPDLRDLIEDIGSDGQQADERRAGACTEHHLEASFEREDLRVEAWAGDDVGQQILDVVEHAAVAHGVGEVEDLLLEQKLFFVIEHRV